MIRIYDMHMKHVSFLFPRVNLDYVGLVLNLELVQCYPIFAVNRFETKPHCLIARW